ncbi:hypothetical protein GOODEAATRI_024147 [Goodea atripinnis]|uniref:Uncharacterized protein n=1 Tax=Goodea atripinnis TaxID=208336 RepID=A0ABV0MUQ0_9TELE
MEGSSHVLLIRYTCTSIKAGVLVFCSSGTYRRVLTQCQGGKTSAVTIEKQLLLLIKPANFTGPVPNSEVHYATFKRNIYKWRKSTVRELPVLPEMDTLGNSPQGLPQKKSSLSDSTGIS